ncbi:helix-turn-helix domain-containing protein [Mycolicibacterium vanbaalenii]|uniref:helix-turn-helix domain-containing protein n=1 Tax=Mycolicibacterium vanbaalenii TaxID=110539 RepID=UPI00241105A7|nr:helix-turn-helix domain-containing protein [Mycolicibacterium vanbaalenii]UJL31613.1 helix-turn-helix domain-containing protein [Mycolicibacterium vanbaalenii]WND58467.1 helix-turn-helix domain-containing protein [Mycolicibacterium vanbaalenii]
MSWKALNWSISIEVETPIERLILMLLANRADQSLSCYPSLGTLVSESCAARSTVLKALSKLEEAGLVVRVAQYHKSGARRPSHYLLKVPDATHSRPSLGVGLPQSANATGSVRSPDRDGSPPGPPEVQFADPLNPSIEPPSEPSPAFVLESLPAPWRISSREARRLSPAIEEAFAAGWTSQTLLAHLSSRPEGVRNPAAVLASRLSELPTPPTFSIRRKTPWCGKCEDPVSRTITVAQSDGTEAARFCPRCSPQQLSVSTDNSTTREGR